MPGGYSVLITEPWSTADFNVDRLVSLLFDIKPAKSGCPGSWYSVRNTEYGIMITAFTYTCKYLPPHSLAI